MRNGSRDAVARELNLISYTVRRFADAASAKEMSAKAECRPTRLDPFIDLVNRRWVEGAITARAIPAELQVLNFTGTANIIYRHLRPLRPDGNGRHRGQGGPALTNPTIPKPHRIRPVLLNHPGHLADQDKQTLACVAARCPHLQRLYGQIRSFAKIMAQCQGTKKRTAWLGKRGS